MFRKYVLPDRGGGLALFAVLHVVPRQQTGRRPPPVMPARAPFARPWPVPVSSRRRARTSPSARTCRGRRPRCMVKVGQKVNAGDAAVSRRRPAVEGRAARPRGQPGRRGGPARQAGADAASPRTCRPARRRVREAEATLADQEDQTGAAAPCIPRRRHRRGRVGAPRQAYRMAREQLARPRPTIKLLEAGAWEPDKACRPGHPGPGEGAGRADEDRARNGWLCEHRWTARCCR